MDRLALLWERQKNFCGNIHYPTREEGTKDLVLHLFSEADEVLNEISWKTHRKEKRAPIIKQNLLEELIDVQKYLWSIAMLWGFTAEEFYDEFIRKSEVVEQRWIQEVELDGMGGFENVVGIDIDGVLAQYPEGFFHFLREQGVDVPADITSPDRLMDNVFSVAQYQNWKHIYRESGYKQKLPLVPRAKDLLYRIKQANLGIVLLTARPYKIHKRIFADTLKWLRDNDLPYHTVLFDEDKNVRLYREFGEKVLFCVEDSRELANSIALLGVRVYLLDKPYNQGVLLQKVNRIYSLDEIKLDGIC